MELIDGEPLAEHFASLREKQQRFTEERIWNIFIQVDTFFPLETLRLCVVCRSLQKLLSREKNSKFKP